MVSAASPEADARPSTVPDRSRILAINGGSSSLKFALFGAAGPSVRLASGRVERIGLADPSWSVSEGEGDGRPTTRRVDAPDHAAAVGLVIEWLGHAGGLASLAAVGHRVVHGGPRYHQPERVTPDLIEELRRILPLDPDHMPGAIAAIEALRRVRPDLPQVACFDTAFHHDLPRVAQILPIPRRFEAAGVRRYGFHGLSYAYLMEELERVAGAEAARGRVILAHLGSGASLAAVLDGQSVDTSMGFTPAAGLVMGTRTGDLDPGLVRFLMQSEGLTAEGFDHLVHRESGLLGLSETSPDLRDLLGRRDDDRAAEAVDLFCYQARKWIGAYAAVLEGVDTLVFSGGIGENSPEVRGRICRGLQFLGIALDGTRNAADGPVISTDAARVAVRVIRTDEERMIARSVARLAP
jgi:acetate kinase